MFDEHEDAIRTALELEPGESVHPQADWTYDEFQKAGVAMTKFSGSPHTILELKPNSIGGVSGMFMFNKWVEVFMFLILIITASTLQVMKLSLLQLSSEIKQWDLKEQNLAQMQMKWQVLTHFQQAMLP